MRGSDVWRSADPAMVRTQEPSDRGIWWQEKRRPDESEYNRDVGGSVICLGHVIPCIIGQV